MAIATPVSFWNMEDTSDFIGGNTLTNNNSITFVSGKILKAASLVRASSQYFSIAHGSYSGLTSNTDFTVNCWINLSTTPGTNITYPIACIWGAGDSTRAWIVDLVNQAGTLKLEMRVDTGAGADDVSVAWTPSTSTWYMLTFNYIKASTTYKFYVNGTQQGATQTGSSGSVASPNEQFSIGNDPDNNNSHFDGLIDAMGYWNSSLSTGDITSLYNGGAGLQEPFVATSNGNFLAFM